MTSAVLAACMQHPSEDAPAPAPVPQTAAAKVSAAAPASAPQEDASLAAHMKTPEFRREYRTKQEQLQHEAQVQEAAPWFGHTGLTDEQERALPRYVRVELGHSLQDANAIRAQDLEFVGHFTEHDGTVYYWRIPAQANAPVDTPQKLTYAYIRKGTDGIFYTDLGNRTPPKSNG